MHVLFVKAELMGNFILFAFRFKERLAVEIDVLLSFVQDHALKLFGSLALLFRHKPFPSAVIGLNALIFFQLFEEFLALSSWFSLWHSLLIIYAFK